MTTDSITYSNLSTAYTSFNNLVNAKNKTDNGYTYSLEKKDSTTDIFNSSSTSKGSLLTSPSKTSSKTSNLVLFNKTNDADNTLNSTTKTNTKDKQNDDSDNTDEKQNNKVTAVVYKPPQPKMVIMTTSDYEKMKSENSSFVTYNLKGKSRYNYPHLGVDLFI